MEGGEGEWAGGDACRYEGVVKQLSRVQSEAREGFGRDDVAQAEISRLRGELTRAQREVAAIREESDRLRESGLEGADADRDRCEALEAELSQVENQLTSSESVIVGLHAELARRDKQKVQDDAYAQLQLNEQQQLVAGLHTQVGQLRARLADHERLAAQAEAAAEQRVQAAVAELDQTRLDLTAAHHLGADCERLTRELSRKTSECDRHAVAATNLQALLEQVGSCPSITACEVCLLCCLALYYFCVSIDVRKHFPVWFVLLCNCRPSLVLRSKPSCCKCNGLHKRSNTTTRRRQNLWLRPVILQQLYR